ncbi:MAG: DNA polymerase III subunit alpha [Cytophagales bacterium]|nr:MAG: DNA polymerase III subunit alpha [Cytophagales bacterium]
MIFNHLHCHTKFSLLDGATDIGDMMKKAASDGMKAVAITDHGNMFGAFQFVNEAAKAGVKPIVGCEFYVVADRHKKSFTKPEKDIRYHQLLLAKNKEGYKNLSKLCSLGWIEGKYGSFPRIDKELIEKYHEGLIATTCCIGAMVPKTILRKSEAEAEKEFLWWLNLFGDDYFVELQRHGIADQDIVNEVLIKFARKHNVPIIASNDSHYLERENAGPHEILLAINTGSKMSDPSSKDTSEDDEANATGKRRFAFSNDEFYFKTTEEMCETFHDLPEAIDNTNLVVDKVETLKLKTDILLPNFPVPSGFDGQWEYLKHITYEGAKKRYIDISQEAQERIDFELFIIKTMGFAGYFLIVADFIKEGRNMGVFVGPGRGSAAGSVVAYCIGITNIDPIKYNLLFERFLNPDRKSMPDIDTDFDDAGRQKVIDYVVEKYGKTQVAQIVTYGSMAAKSSIKDVSRVMDLPLDEANYLAKLIPDTAGISLGRIFHAPLNAQEGDKKKKEQFEKQSQGKNLTDEAKKELKGKLEKKYTSLSEKENLDSDELERIRQLREIYESDSIKGKILKDAEVLEGSVRSTGVHAAGIIIAPSDLTELMPMATAKDSNFLLTQYEGSIIEDAGVIKMDFLGLKTLTIIKNTLKLIKQNHGIDIIIDDIDLLDKATLETFQRGETNGIFQFESPGMQKHMKDLKPDRFEDIIAMNALYRPGPIAYIPNYINRKHGREAVVYDIDDMKEYLEETYGITVYQEQVMLLSQSLAGFTKGEADVLRKAMGKKQKDVLDKMKAKFIEGAVSKGHAKDKLEKVWTDWEAFAQYAFNKSHSTCYAFVAFQTAWLKTHYPSEYMAANLTNEKDNIDKVTFFMEECKRMGLKVLGPNVNESDSEFGVNAKGEILFGMGAIKGTGGAAIEAIIDERNNKGIFKNIFEFSERVNLRTVNKKTFEAFAQAGGFDCFEDVHRGMFFHKEPGEESTFIEKIIRHAGQVQELKNSNTNSLFGNMGNSVAISNPRLPVCETWGQIEKLRLEKEVVGFYISGHPLDEFKLEFDTFVNATLNNIDNFKDKEITVAGVVTSAQTRTGKNGQSFGIYKIEDYTGSQEFLLFKEDFLKLGYMMVLGQYLFLRCKVQPKWNVIDKYEIKPISVELLQEIRSKRTKKVTLEIPSESITSRLIDELEKAASQHKGNCELRLNITHNGSNLSMFSRKFTINPSNEFFKIMTESRLKYRLN